MSITPQSFDQVRSQLVAFVLSRKPELATARDTDLGMQIDMVAEALYGLYEQLAAAYADLFPSVESSPEALDLHARSRLVGGRKGAIAASGTAALRVTGTDGAVVAAGTELVATDGTTYHTIEALTLGLTETADIDVQASAGGAEGNRDAGSILTWVSAPAGIDAQATLVLDVTGGADQESDGALLQRLLAAYRSPVTGGSFADFRSWAEAVPEVVAAYVYGPQTGALTARRGKGTLDIVVTKAGSGLTRIPSAALCTAVLAAIEESRPALAADIAVLAPGAVTVNVGAVVDPQPGYECDWINSPAATVSSYSHPALVFAAALPASLGQGDRLAVAGQLVTVLTINTPAHSVTIDTTLSPAPTPGTIIYAGGPLSAPCFAAVRAVFDTLGPTRGLAANPHHDWTCDLYRSALIAALMGVPGVKNALVNPPATDQTSSEVDDVPTLFVPGVIDLLFSA